MHGLMMDFPLTLTTIFRRAETMFGPREVVTRAADRAVVRCTYRDVAARVRRLMGALAGLGLGPGDRVATLCWNHAEHLEAYFAVPLGGGVLHTLNLRLHPEELAYIINHAGDRALIVDTSLLPLFERIRPLINVPIVIVVGPGSLPDGALAYDALVAGGTRVECLPELEERTAAALCYTTGTTGRPKGVLYSHRSLVLHSLGISLADAIALTERDAVLPVVPMFHANAWGLPYAALMVGAKLVMPGPHLDPASLADLMARERVTLVAGVPTIWMALLQLLDLQGSAYDLSSVRSMIVGGAAVPQSLIEGFERRHGLHIVQGWGMTEMSPVGSLSTVPSALTGEPVEARFAYRATAGRPLPFVEIRARNEDGLVPWDGDTMGELEVRGPWIAAAYFEQDEVGAERFTSDGWFKTGDIVTIDAGGTIRVQDRAKDLIKSGGEWISSIALETALMGHPSVAEAAVIPVGHPRWGERPLATVVLKPHASVTGEELRSFLAPKFPKFWLPDAFEFIDAVPRTSVGKFQKSALRERFRDYVWSE